MSDQTFCCLCGQIQGDRENDLIDQLLAPEEYIRRIPLETEMFAVIPSLGPVAPGHTLLCPKMHHRSFASLTPEYEAEFSHIKGELIRALTTIYDAPIHCFEHGSDASGERVLCTVEHAHLHFVPANTSIREHLDPTVQWTEVQPTLHDIRAEVADNEYLYYEAPDGHCVVARPNKQGFESQYLRKIFVNAIESKRNWNWREDPLPYEVDCLHHELASYFSKA